MITSSFQNIFKILNWRMVHNKMNCSFRKKMAPPIEGRALLNKRIITLSMQKAS
jgi:hypothetical protein